MKITLNQWLELEDEARRAKSHLEKISNAACRMFIQHHNDGNTREAELLRRINDRVDQASSELAASLFHVQSEWTGGDTDNPKNSTLREPNWVPISHSFPREQVEEYRDPDGAIIIPHRQPSRAYMASDIQWDTNGQDVDLPPAVVFADYQHEHGVDHHEYISDWLSDTFGFCHKGFTLTEISNG